MKKLLICSVFFCIAYSFNSCNTDEFQSSTEFNSNVKKINYEVHFSNPYDTIGKYHNEALAYVFKEYFNSPASRAKQLDALDDIMLDYFKRKPFMDDFSVTKEEINNYKRLRARSSEMNDTISLSEKQQVFCDTLNDIVRNKNYSSSQDLISEINKVEKQINESDMPEEEIIALLSTTAVAKYSAIYWIEQLEKMYSTQIFSRGVGGEEEMYGGNWDRWFQDLTANALTVIESDYKGAFAGAVGALLFIRSSGPLVAGLGFAVIKVIIFGAVSSAIVASAFSGIEIIWEVMHED